MELKFIAIGTALFAIALLGCIGDYKCPEVGKIKDVVSYFPGAYAAPAAVVVLEDNTKLTIIMKADNPPQVGQTLFYCPSTFALRPYYKSE